MILHGFDVIAIAESGSGKSIGFLLPGILHINAQSKLKEGEGPIMLILVPARELAVQI